MNHRTVGPRTGTNRTVRTGCTLALLALALAATRPATASELPAAFKQQLLQAAGDQLDENGRQALATLMSSGALPTVLERWEDFQRSSPAPVATAPATSARPAAPESAPLAPSATQAEPLTPHELKERVAAVAYRAATKRYGTLSADPKLGSHAIAANSIEQIMDGWFRRIPTGLWKVDVVEYRNTTVWEQYLPPGGYPFDGLDYKFRSHQVAGWVPVATITVDAARGIVHDMKMIE